jgi:uncharacterized protein (TIGR03437 family)
MLSQVLKWTIRFAWLPWWFAAEQPLPAQNIRVPSWGQLVPDGGRVAWSVNNVIAYDTQIIGRYGSYYNLYTINPDGSSNTCLTCPGAPGVSTSGLPGYNAGNPIWTPDGKFIVFQVEMVGTGDSLTDFWDYPGIGFQNDLWATDTHGNFWRLTKQATISCGGGSNCGAVICPTFSHDGTKLAWGQRTNTLPAKPTSLLGTWELAVGTWSETGGIPSINTPTYYSPGTNNYYYEPHGFSRDNQTVFFMGNLTPGMEEYAFNIYSFNLQTSTLTNLTNTLTDWYEYPVSLPSADKLVYMYYPRVSEGYPTCHSDLWLMNYDGSDKERLTFYNDIYSKDYVPQGVCLDTHQWNANGSQLAVFSNDFAANNHTGKPGPILMLDIQPATTSVNGASYVFPPLAPGSIVSTFGTNLANQTLAAPSAALPTNLSNTTVSVTDAKGVARPASVYFVSAGQVNFVIPDATGPGPAVFTVTNAEGVQSLGTVDIAPVSPAFYSMNQNGQGVVAGYVQVLPASGQSTYVPVYSCPGGGAPCTTRPIDISNRSDRFYLTMFGTGLRGRSSLQGVSVTIADQSVPVLYASAQGQYDGFDQLDIQLPNSLAGVGVVNIVATVDGATSNAVQIQLQ